MTSYILRIYCVLILVFQSATFARETSEGSQQLPASDIGQGGISISLVFVQQQPQLEESINFTLYPYPLCCHLYTEIENKTPENCQILSVPIIQCRGRTLRLVVRDKEPMATFFKCINRFSSIRGVGADALQA